MIDEFTKLDYTLKVLKEHRETLYEDSRKGKRKVTKGLFEERPAVSQLYLDSYRLGWIDTHWQCVSHFADKSFEKQTDRNDLCRYFAEKFRRFIEKYGYNNPELSELFFKQLELEQVTIGRLLRNNAKYDDWFGDLLNLHDMHRKRFQRKRQELEERLQEQESHYKCILAKHKANNEKNRKDA